MILTIHLPDGTAHNLASGIGYLVSAGGNSMGTAYTPGLTVSADTVISKVRRLPIKGQVLVSVGEQVQPDTIVAKAELPGPVTTLRAADQLGVERHDLPAFVKKKEGERVEAQEVLAERKSFFGLFTTQVKAPVSGTIEFISEVTGNIGIRHLPTPVDVKAYIEGEVSEVMEGEGAVIETRGALMQGIFGVGGERHGELTVIARAHDEQVPADRLNESHKGKIIVGGSVATWELLQAVQRIGAVGLVVGSIMDADLKRLLGYELGVAITGEEQVGFTLVVTEGFGQLPMAERTFELLKSLEGRRVSISGATQIRAGVIRPEVIIPRPELKGKPLPPPSVAETGELEIGTEIRLIREPHFGKLGRVTGLPPEPIVIETGAKVRVLEAVLDSGERIIVPRANVEIVEH